MCKRDIEKINSKEDESLKFVDPNRTQSIEHTLSSLIHILEKYGYIRKGEVIFLTREESEQRSEAVIDEFLK